MHFVMQKLLQKENEDYLNHTVSLQFEWSGPIFLLGALLKNHLEFPVRSRNWPENIQFVQTITLGNDESKGQMNTTIVYSVILTEIFTVPL